MVNHCTVCLNNSRKNRNISYFIYPKNTTRRNEWLKAVGREDLLPKLIDDKIRQFYRICEDHFERTCFKFSMKRKYLLDNAFPTLNLSSNVGAGASSKQYDNVPIQGNQNIQFISTTETCSTLNNPCNIIVVDKIYHSTQTDSDKKIICDSRSAQTVLHPSADTPRKRKLALELRERKIHKKCDLDSVTNEDFLKLCDKFLTKGMSQIIKWQVDMKAGYSGNRYSQAFKFFALNLHYAGPAAYKFLRNTFCLPSVVTLQRLVKPIGTKVDERLLCALKTKVDKMDTQEKICSFCVDCMSLKSNLFYDVKNDRIVGFHEINGIQNKEPAKYVIVMMIRGITHNWKQPIAYSFLSQSKNYPEVNELIDEIMISLLNIGLDIRVFISDLGSDFLSGSKSRFVSRDKTYFELNGNIIYYMFDVPHLIKCVRNKFEICDFVFDGNVVKWSHIRDLFNEDKKRQIRLAPKLTDIHMDLNNFEKMPVKVATQVLSRTVASAINTYVDLNVIDGAARTTADFVNRINNLFDILNSSTLRSPNKYKRAFRGINYQIEFLEEMLTLFNNLKFIKIEGQKDVTNVNFIYGFQVSIKSLLQLHTDLKSEENKFIFTRRLNLDCLKNFFSKVRQAGGNCQEPTCRQVSIAFNKMFITNILKRPQNTNCDQDFDSLLMNPDDCHVFHTPSEVSQPFDITNTPELTVGTSDYRFDLPEKNSLLYVSVYLYRKCLEHHQCDNIKMYVNRSEQPTNMGKDSVFSHYKDFDEADVQSVFLVIPPDNFIAYVQLLEQTFREYFNFEINIVNIGNDILNRMPNCKFNMPCECFPFDYLKKLYIRFRIYHSIKKYNKLLKTKNHPKIFRVCSL